VIAVRTPAGQPRRAAALLSVLVAVLALAGCAGAAPSVQTSDVFAAAPWRAGERLEYRLRNDQGDALGTGVLTVTQEGDRFVLGQSYTEDPGRTPEGAPALKDEMAVTVDARTLKPLQGVRTSLARDSRGRPQESRLTWSYAAEGDRLRLATRVEREGSSPEEGSILLRPHAYDNESSLWLWRAIAFAEGYDEAYVSANAFDRTQQNVSLRVPQRERVEVPAGEFEAWRILLRSGRAVRTAWISVDAPHHVLRWDNGEVIFELTKAE
jgi:hypothetical protein